MLKLAGNLVIIIIIIINTINYKEWLQWLGGTISDRKITGSVLIQSIASDIEQVAILQHTHTNSLNSAYSPSRMESEQQFTQSEYEAKSSVTD